MDTPRKVYCAGGSALGRTGWWSTGPTRAHRLVPLEVAFVTCAPCASEGVLGKREKSGDCGGRSGRSTCHTQISPGLLTPEVLQVQVCISEFPGNCRR